MRILFLTHRLPYPPDKGEKIRAFHELKYLAARHEVDLFCLADSADEIANHAAYLQNTCRRVHVVALNKWLRLVWALWSSLLGRSFSFGYFRSSKFRRAVRHAVRTNRYDLVFVNCSSMAQYVSQPALAPLIVDFVDADSNKFRQYAERSSSLPLRVFYRHEAKRVAAMERSIGRLADLSLVITSNDAEELGASVWSGSEIRVLSAGIEVPPQLEDDPAVKQLQPFVLFLGTMSYWPNADAAAHFARDIFPLVRKLNPDLRFVIAGRNPGKQVRELACLPGVTVVGSVPEPFQYFRAATVSVAPFRISQGFQFKVAESLAVGTPVVSSARAASAIGLTEKEGLFTADGISEFAKRVVEVVADCRLRQALKERAPAVCKQLSWDSKLRDLSLYLEEVIGAATASESSTLAGYGVEQR
jgi:polysaccharide biosynthesis protein PslH